jgi:hypothetical protein
VRLGGDPALPRAVCDPHFDPSRPEIHGGSRDCDRALGGSKTLPGGRGVHPRPTGPQGNIREAAEPALCAGFFWDNSAAPFECRGGQLAREGCSGLREAPMAPDLRELAYLGSLRSVQLSEFDVRAPHPVFQLTVQPACE